MSQLLNIFSFVLGAIIGSFLNVVALRYNTGMTLKGRSKCFSCGKNLQWHELIPFFSFFFQKGKCKVCKGKISWQYPLVEGLAGLLFILVFYYFPPVSLAASINTVFYLFISCLLIVITIYDIKHKIIPNPFVYTFIAASFIKLFIVIDSSGMVSFALPTLMDVLAGPILALPFLLLSIISQGTWMGYADSKLVLGIGWTLGLVAGISAITLAFWIGAVVSLLFVYIVFRKFKSRYEIPFGPYLILGMYLVLFFNINVIQFSL